MHAFIATVVNNDILAEVAVSALFVSLIALIRWPGGLRGLAVAALSVVLALASIPTKSTATAAALPLLAGGLLVWVGALVVRRLAVDEGGRTKDESSRSAHRPRNAILRPSSFLLRRRSVLHLIPGLAAILLVALAFAGAILLAYRHDDNSAAGWFMSYEPIQRAARVQSSTAHQGSYVIELGTTAATREAFQNLVPPVYHPAFNVTFSGWARLAPGQTSSAGKVSARLSIMEGASEAGFGVGQPDPSGDWIHLTASGKISASAARVTLGLEAAGQTAEKLQFDDLSLQTSAVGAPWNDPIYKPVLLDPSAEEPPTVLNGVLNRIVPSEVNAMADALANPQPFDKGTLWRDYAGFQYQTFWGSFGWITINLPPLFYILLGLLALAALAGLAIGMRSNVGYSAFRIPHSALQMVVLLSLTATILISFAKQMSLLAYTGLPAYPQGRYLFVLAIPITWLLLTGLSEIGRRLSVVSCQLLSCTRTIVSRRTIDDEPLPTAHWFGWLWASALGFFAAYCLLALIMPFYYS